VSKEIKSKIKDKIIKETINAKPFFVLIKNGEWIAIFFINNSKLSIIQTKAN
jgi:hypothetical protein